MCIYVYLSLLGDRASIVDNKKNVEFSRVYFTVKSPSMMMGSNGWWPKNASRLAARKQYMPIKDINNNLIVFSTVCEHTNQRASDWCWKNCILYFILYEECWSTALLCFFFSTRYGWILWSRFFPPFHTYTLSDLDNVDQVPTITLLLWQKRKRFLLLGKSTTELWWWSWWWT